MPKAEMIERLLAMFDVLDVIRDNQSMGGITLQRVDKPIKTHFINTIQRVTDIKYPVYWAVCCLYVICQYLMHVKYDLRDDSPVSQETVLPLLEQAPRLLDAVLQPQASREDVELIARMPNTGGTPHNPMHELIYRMFMRDDSGPTGVFDTMQGTVKSSMFFDPLYFGKDGAGTKQSVNVCITAAILAKLIKTQCAQSPARCTYTIEDFRRKIAIALASSIRQDSDAEVACRSVASCISTSTKTGLQWISDARLSQIIDANFVDQPPKASDFREIFRKTIVNLRSVYTLFGQACVSITDDDRRRLDAITTAAVEADAGFLNLGSDNTQRYKQNMRLLLASVVNTHYIVKVFMSLPWIAQIFSIDDLPRFFARVLDPTNAPDRRELLRKEVEARQLIWLALFFVRIAPQDQNMLQNILIGSQQSIQHDIAADTAYVSNILRLNVDKNAAFISRIHLHRYLALILNDKIGEIGNDDIISFAIRYVAEFVQKFDELASYNKGVKLFQDMESAAIATPSTSKSTVISYVRIRANEDKYNERHRFIINPATAITQFFVRYNTQYALSPDQQRIKSKILSLLDNGAPADQQQLKPPQPSNAYAFGPFTRVFYNNHTNADIGQSTYEVMHGLLNRKSVLVMGFGISGAGKTSTLIYLKPSVGPPQRGVVLNWIIQLQRKGYFTDGIKYRAVEYYGQGDAHNAWAMYNMLQPISQRSQADVVNVYADVTSDESAWTAVKPAINGDPDAMINTLGEQLVNLVTHPAFRQTKPTTNNDSSSRSHVVFTIQVSKTMADAERCYLHIVDLAGVENRFDTTSETAVSGFKDPSRQSCKPPGEYQAFFHELNQARRSDTSTHLSSTVVKCSAFERYVFHNDPSFIEAAQGVDIEEENAKKLLAGFSSSGLGIREWFMKRANPVDLRPTQSTVQNTAVYAASQLWGSVIMNPYAKYAIAKQQQLSIDIPSDPGQALMFIKWRATLASQSLEGAIFAKAMEMIARGSKVSRPAPVTWAEPLQFAGTSKFNGDASVFTIYPSGKARNDAAQKAMRPVIVEEALKGQRIKGSAYDTLVTKGQWTKGSAYGKLYEKAPLKPTQFYANIKALWVVPPDAVPPIMTMDIPPPSFSNISMIDVEKLKGIKHSILNAPGPVSPDTIAASIISALTLFHNIPGNNSDDFWKSITKNTKALQEVLVLLFGNEANGSFTAQIQQFLTFFVNSHDQPEAQQRLYAYLLMMYSYVATNLALDKSTLSACLDPKSDTNLLNAYDVEWKLRAAVPLSMFALRKELKYADYASFTPPWTSPDLKKIVVLEDIINEVRVRGQLNTDMNLFDMGIAEMFNVENGATVVKCMNLPVSATGCPIVVDQSGNVSMRPSDISFDELKHMVDFSQYASGSVRYWINILFLFGQVTAGVERIAALKNDEYDRHVKFYMENRTKEGMFINKTVYALRNSLFGIVEKQNASNPYGNPMFLSQCSFFGCHPVLDPYSFRQPDEKTSALSEPDRLMNYVSKFQDDKDLRICLMTAINLSSSVPDPPAVPYINYTKLMHAYRVYTFLGTGNNIDHIIHSTIKPANGSPSIKLDEASVSSDNISNPVGLDIVSRESNLVLLRNALQDLRGEIENALPMAASIEHVLRDVRVMIANLQKGIQPQSKDIKTILNAITFYNNSSLIGNLSFVDSLQKRAAEGICDISDRPTEEALYTIDIPKLCGHKALAHFKDLTKSGDVVNNAYSPANLEHLLRQS